MNNIARIVADGRQAVHARDWNRVMTCAFEIQRRAPRDAEGPFLLGLAQKAALKAEVAARLFAQALELDSRRYDAAIELAFQNILLNKHGEARDLLERHTSQLSDSPLYLDLAGQAYSRMNMHSSAWPLYQRAQQLQPDVEVFQTHLAGCAVYLGDVEVARKIYTKLLKRHPTHQRNHYELAQLRRATNDRHVRQMIAVLKKADPDPARNIFLFYALGKELEDLERWDESFEFYKKGGDAARGQMDYDVASDIAVIDTIIETCDANWLVENATSAATEKTPIFVVGLPRTGTTLTDRILSSHSRVESAGETQLLHMVLRRESGLETGGELTPEVIVSAAGKPADIIARGYMDAIAYRLGPTEFFVDKLPENVLNLGFVAKGWPDARIVHLRRHPMDACFAMYKQSYFRFAYTLDDLAQYYLAYDRLTHHWRSVLGDRLVEVEYEQLVGNQEQETRRLLDRLGLPFEDACLHFEKNTAAIATASSVQVRESVHTRSVAKWKKFETQLEPLRASLAAGGVEL